MKKNKFKWLIVCLAVVLIALFGLSSDYFLAEEIKTIGNSRLDREYIIKQAGLDGPVNIFRFDSGGAKRALLKNTYIDSVQIKTDYLARTITIKVKERILSGYVEDKSGAFLYIDENGRILEAANSYTEKLPIVVGLKFSSYTVGELLEVSNKDSFNVLVVLAQLFNKYDMGAEVIKVDVSDVSDIHIYINEIDVELGEISDVDEKIRRTKTILETETFAKENTKGFLDVKDINKPSVFRMLR